LGKDAEKTDNETTSSKSIGVGRLLNKQAPDFVVKTVEGQTLNLKELKGKVVVLNFWFTTCSPCLAEIPELNQLVDTFKDKEVIFIAISLDSKETLAKFLDKRPFSYHIIPLYTKIIADYQVFSFPTHVIIDKNGNVRHTHVGATEREMYGPLKNEIDKLLSSD